MIYKNEIIEKLKAVMNKNYHEKDHICLKSFIDDVGFFALDRYESELEAGVKIIKQAEEENKKAKKELDYWKKSFYKQIEASRNDTSTT